jgi:hypothetical protein
MAPLARMNLVRYRFFITLKILSAGLLLLGGLRLLAFVLHKPLLGYANNFDFVRVESCFALHPMGQSLGQAHFPAPFSIYEISGPVDMDKTYFGSELGVVALAIMSNTLINLEAGLPVNVFNLHVLGLVNALLLLATGVWLAVLYQRIWRWGGLVASAIFSLVFCDPLNGLYLNSLYSEFSVLIFGYLAVGIGLYVVLAPRPPAGLITALGAALFFLGMSKGQFFLLPLLLVAVGALLRWLYSRSGIGRRWPVRLAVLFVLFTSIFCMLIQQKQIDRKGYFLTIKMANRIDTFFGAILPSMRNPQQGLKILGLPPECAFYVGKTWYSPEIRPLRHADKLLRLSQFKVLSLLYAEPDLILTLAKKAIPLSRPWIYQDLGHIEGQEFGRIKSGLFSGQWSIVTYVDRLPGWAYSLFIIFCTAAFLAAVLVLLYSIFKKNASTHLRSAASAVFLLGMVILYTLYSSLFGDGFQCVYKHFYLGQVMLLAVFPFSLALMLSLLGRCWERARRTHSKFLAQRTRTDDTEVRSDKGAEG